MDFKKVTHCIFDMDGLLLDTETLYTVAYNRVTQEFGKTYTWQHKAKIMGFKSTDAVQTIIDILELPIMVQEFEDKLTTLYQELFPQCNLMPGVERLLRHLKENNIPIALATSSSQESSDLKTQRWKHIFDYFDHKVYGGSDPEVPQGKPSPDIFLIAARRFPDNPDPSKCLVFEDSPNGVQAAIAAKMQVVMVPDPQLPKQLMKDATLVLKSLEDFKPESFGLPPIIA
ncbi:pseudouridine-5'-phosphatase isoform X1 [Harpegnathos saltator]|uniref:pseudouridine 5'-phosphatase n=1 Tax=Harpegnathos saltator TaxID=610380 RepID=E2BE28_HARSA|nr:pseudouridine-5'-phosphatase isoform X1 [Harpegnathos saltator]EFN86015.1 GS1-like protein [Harpegnathos saltator]